MPEKIYTCLDSTLGGIASGIEERFANRAVDNSWKTFRDHLTEAADEHLDYEREKPGMTGSPKPYCGS